MKRRRGQACGALAAGALLAGCVADPTSDVVLGPADLAALAVKGTVGSTTVPPPPEFAALCAQVMRAPQPVAAGPLDLAFRNSAHHVMRALVRTGAPEVHATSYSTNPIRPGAPPGVYAVRLARPQCARQLRTTTRLLQWRDLTAAERACLDIRRIAPAPAEPTAEGTRSPSARYVLRVFHDEPRLNDRWTATRLGELMLDARTGTEVARTITFATAGRDGVGLDPNRVTWGAGRHCPDSPDNSLVDVRLFAP